MITQQVRGRSRGKNKLSCTLRPVLSKVQGTLGSALSPSFICDTFTASQERKTLVREQSLDLGVKGLERASSQTALQVAVPKASQETHTSFLGSTPSHYHVGWLLTFIYSSLCFQNLRVPDTYTHKALHTEFFKRVFRTSLCLCLCLCQTHTHTHTEDICVY